MEGSIIRDAGKGILAGIAATIVLALLMLLKDALGLVPGLDLVAAVMKMAGVTSALTGWIIFAVVYALIIGLVFSSLDAHLERPEGAEEFVRGGLFGVGVWLLAMILLMPMTGSGAFAMNYGIAGPIVMLVVHVIYGVTLGGVYGLMRPEPVMT